ncbi:ABC transporter ATP-binding protein [Acetobacter estunensis NRIC 0472]|uniref:ATP-binding cassette domain-containing protein n=1 Tax=Acetobacter estunensis TaxID=104097 RepID=A0A967ECZ9_9PROT|nr:ABC transporter ATP-binding protein/permease [Acetobacter estunensis]NHO53796.1 ATP-binding cassette domain-containing protein [Acetobacter estunensis]GBQ20030.1 ABC transporter ATP-binding protein [Acetobacter estunensis NRIC 0472]
MKKFRRLVSEVWYLSRPYFTSEDRKWAWGLLLAVVALTLILVGLDVLQSFSRNIYYTALQQRDVKNFMLGLFWYVRTPDGLVPGFFIIAIPSLLGAVYATYLQQLLQLRWRGWMTRHMLAQWLERNTAFLIAVHEAGLDTAPERESTPGQGPDNPDQRIQEDIDRFAADTLTQVTDLLSNVITLCSYVGLLWVLSGPLVVLGVRIPGYFLWVALIYSIVATLITHLAGRRLIGLRMFQQKVEADFRYALVHVRNNAESIALTGGAAQEQAGLLGKFTSVYGNFLRIMNRTKWLGLLTSGLEVLSGNFALLVGSIRYFANKISFGTLMQLVLAFSRVQGALGWIASSYASLAEWRANVARLATFQRTMDRARAHEQAIERVKGAADSDLLVEHLSIMRPDGSVLLNDVCLTLPRGRNIALTGPSGIGKSTFLRVLAGIWPFAAGRIVQPDARMMFVPQTPYLPLGTLRQALCYPGAVEAHTPEAVNAVLAKVGLAAFAGRLDEEARWAETLSAGEQQRLLFGRVLLTAPDWVFLDESTSSLDEDAETALYSLLRTELPSVTLVSITHRPGLLARQDVQLDIAHFRPAGPAVSALG